MNKLVIRSKSQAQIEILIQSTQLKGVSHEIVGAIVFGIVASEHKRMLCDELNSVLDINRICAPVFGVDTDGLVNEWNSMSEDVFGLSREEVLGNCLIDAYISAECRSSARQVLSDACAGKGTANMEWPFLGKDQRRVEMMLNASPQIDAKGKFSGVIWIGHDITERKKIEVEKTSLAQELQTFIDTANAPIFGIDAEGLVNEWNNKSAAITGFSKEEVLGKNLVEVRVTKSLFCTIEICFSLQCPILQCSSYKIFSIGIHFQGISIQRNGITRQRAARPRGGQLRVPALHQGPATRGVAAERHHAARC
jgi:PAS domain S-box-containing protein